MTMKIEPYAAAVLKLLSDVLYYSDKEWGLLLTYQSAVRQHFGSIGMALHLDEAEGFAYLTQPDPEQLLDEDGIEVAKGTPLPRLVRRTRLSYQATLLCVLLREELQKFDAREPDQTRLVLSTTQIRDLIFHFYPDRADMTRVQSRIETTIRQVVTAGFLRELPSTDEPQYEVLRIIKAKLSSDILAEVQANLVAYVETAGSKQAHEESV